MSTNPTNQAAADQLARKVAADLAASRDQSGLEAAPNVDLNFQHAQKSPQPLETPSPGPPPRTASYAKTLDPGYQPPTRTNALNTYPVQQEQDQGDQQQGEGSGMVQNDKPEMKPVNRSEEAKAVDRSKFNQAWTDEKDRADQVNRLAEQVAADLKASRAQQQPEQERGMGMG